MRERLGCSCMVIYMYTVYIYIYIFNRTLRYKVGLETRTTALVRQLVWPPQATCVYMIRPHSQPSPFQSQATGFEVDQPASKWARYQWLVVMFYKEFQSNDVGSEFLVCPYSCQCFFSDLSVTFRVSHGLQCICSRFKILHSSALAQLLLHRTVHLR